MEEETKYLLCCGVKRLAKRHVNSGDRSQKRLVIAARRKMEVLQETQSGIFKYIKQAGKVFSEATFPDARITNKLQGVIHIVDNILDHGQIPMKELQVAFIDVVKETIQGGVTRAVIIYAVMAAYAVIRHYYRKHNNKSIFDFIERFAEILFSAFEVCKIIEWLRKYGWGALQKRNFDPAMPMLLCTAVLTVGGLVYVLMKL